MPNNPLTSALYGSGLAGLGGSYGLAGSGGPGGMTFLDDLSSYTGEHEGQGFDIATSDIGDTPMGMTTIHAPETDTPIGTPIDYDPTPPYDTPTELPIVYNPTPTPTSPPVDIDTHSYTPPATPGQIPQFSMPNFAFNFPMPDINPLVGGPNMGPVGFYSANSGAAGLPVPAYGGIENPNLLPDYVQQFVGGPDVLTRSLIG